MIDEIKDKLIHTTFPMSDSRFIMVSNMYDNYSLADTAQGIEIDLYPVDTTPDLL